MQIYIILVLVFVLFKNSFLNFYKIFCIEFEFFIKGVFFFVFYFEKCYCIYKNCIFKVYVVYFSYILLVRNIFILYVNVKLYFVKQVFEKQNDIGFLIEFFLFEGIIIDICKIFLLIKYIFLQ